MKLSRRSFNSLNITLAILVLVAVAYISYLATSPNPNSNKSGFNETRISSALYPGFDTSSLSKDLSKINLVVARESQDQALANQIMTASSGHSGSGLLLNQHLSWLNDLSVEINAATALSPAQQAALSAKIANTRSALGWLKNVIHNSHLKNASAAAVVSPNYALFNELGPQVSLIKVADDEQLGELLLNNISAKLTAAVQSAAVQGVTATNFDADLTTLDEDAAAGKALSASAESQLLSGGYILKNITQNISTGTRDINAGLNAATTIVNGLISS